MASTGNLDASPILRWIEAHLDYPHKDYCLIWPFGLRAGYGFFTLDEKTVCAHRYICERKHGPAPFGHVASHSCDRGHEACVNHHHLSWQTNSSNQLRRKDHKGGRRFKLGWDEVETILKLKGIETPVDTAKRRKDWRTDPERDTYRLQNLEWVVQAMLEKLRDDETAKQAQFVETPWGRKD